MNSRILLSGCFIVLALLINSTVVNSADKEAVTQSLSPFDASYNAVIKGFKVNAKRTFTRNDSGSYTLLFTADSWAASITESSVFSEAKGLLNTQHYQFEQSALGKKKYRSLLLSDDKKSLISQDGKDQAATTSTNTYPQVLDKLNYQIQLALDIAAGKNQLAYTVIDRGTAKTYRFSVADKEVIESDVGQLNTIKVKVTRDGSNKETFIWFAPDWSYLLVQLQQFQEDKETLSIRLKQATVNTVAVKGL